MKKFFIGLFIISFTLLLAESVSFETSIGNFKMVVEENGAGNTVPDLDIAGEIAKRVEFLENKYLAKLNKLDQKKAAKITDEIYELLALLPENVELNISSYELASESSTSANTSLNVSMNFSEEAAAEPVESSNNSAMNSSDFQRLLNNIKAESFADDQLSVLNMAVPHSYFSINQLIQIVDLFTFDDDKISAVEIVAPKIVDLQNGHNLLNAFTYSDDKAAVEKIINSQ
ncbi:MAG: DUF4476 domain-containing protein [Candidatus Cloacimonadales bacterium]